MINYSLIMSMETPQAGLWEGVDPSTLYNSDGTINEAAIEKMLEERLGGDEQNSNIKYKQASFYCMDDLITAI